MKILISEATNDQLNYLVAKLKNHEYRYPWLSEQGSYRSWQSNEEAWGNPTPDYCSEGIELIQEECNTFYKSDRGWDCIVGDLVNPTMQ